MRHLLPCLLALLVPAALFADRGDDGYDAPSDSGGDGPPMTRSSDPPVEPEVAITGITCLTAGQDTEGEILRITARVPVFRLAALTSRAPGERGWTQHDEEVLSLDGTVQFDVWAPDPQRLFRVESRPLPVNELMSGGERLLELTDEISNEHLSLYLRSKFGMKGTRTLEGRVPTMVEPPGLPTNIFEFEGASVITTTTGNLDGARGLQGLVQRPRLALISPDPDPVTSASAVIGESLEVPLGWKIVSPQAVRARYVIQRTPFENPYSYTQPPAKSVVGWIERGGTDNLSKAFWLDFGQSVSLYGYELPQPFFVRIYEEDAQGNILGVPSNTFTFVIREEPPDVPAGLLRFRLKRIKCWDPTNGDGDDELAWQVLRIRFTADKVICDYPGHGYRELSGGEAFYPNVQLFNHVGPADYPDLANTWYIITLRDLDKNAEQVAEEPDPSASTLSYLATGMLNHGKSHAKILERIEDETRQEVMSYLSYAWSWDAPDMIGMWTFRLHTGMVDEAVQNGRERKTISMHGTHSSYSIWFDLDFYPN